MLDISVLDWIVIFVYLFALIVFAYVLSREQFNREDYYVGARTIGRWPIAISILATQCSTNSILGAPAFVAFASGGGLVWLQYEIALPLAMIPLILVFIPLFRRLKLVSVYAYLERCFGVSTRLVLGGIFLFVRAFATAVTVYSIAIVIDLISGIGFFWAVILLGVFTVLYDVMGGIRGVIYSDVIQMLILVFVLLLLFVYLLFDNQGITTMLGVIPDARKATLDFSHHGFGDGHSFAFWPMLFGGFFLYASYYGCDQSQVQRTLSARTENEGNAALAMNGLLRFPLVALYCFVGLGIAAYAVQHQELLDALPSVDGKPNVNLVVPAYMIQRLPDGIVGLGLVALFAAAMSSLDSVLNALSATTMEDFVRRAMHNKDLDAKVEIWLSRAITAVWGFITLAAAFWVGDIAPTVLEAINKIGSLINGPVLAVFAMGIFLPMTNKYGALAGLILGFLTNLWLWQYAPLVSWLWWNVIGLVVALFTGIMVSYFVPVCPQPDQGDFQQWQKQNISMVIRNSASKKMMYLMTGWFAVLLFVLIVFKAFL